MELFTARSGTKITGKDHKVCALAYKNRSLACLPPNSAVDVDSGSFGRNMV